MDRRDSTDPADHTSDQAVDPSTPAHVLEDIARSRPELRALVLLNPSTSASLRDWIEQGPPDAPDEVPEDDAARQAGRQQQPVRGPAVPRRPRTGRGLRRLRTGLLRTAVVALFCLTALAAGTVLGWTAQAHQQARRQQPEPRVTTIQVPAYGNPRDAVMPDVRGLDRDSALQVLADAGVPVQSVALSERQAAGPVGAVVEQTPAFGTRSPTSVALVTSTQALVPDVAGRAATDLVTDLGSLGAQVTQVPQYRAGAAAGQALSIDPAPGQPLPQQVAVAVAEPASSLFLTTLDPVEGGCSSGSRVVNGTTYDHALSCSASGQPQDVRWVLSRRADGVQGVIGLPDEADPGTRVRVEVLADGQSRAAVTVAPGQPAPLDVPVTGALQMTVRVQRVDAVQTSTSAEAVLGDVRLVGGSTQIAALGKQP